MTTPPETSAYRDAAAPSGKAPWNPRAVRAFQLALASILALPVAIALARLAISIAPSDPGVVPGVALLAGVVAGPWLGFLAVRRGRAVRDEVPAHPVAERGRGLAAAAVPMGVLGVVFSVLGFVFACLSTMAFSRGRQLRRRGRILLPPVGAGARWTTQSLAVDVAGVSREALAAQWRENGRTEHASVAAFARVALDLMGLGAPPALLAAANRDALDEIRHTELCFSLARAIDGRAESPGAFAEASSARALLANRSLALARLAVDSLVDGALHEGVSARVIARLAKRCEEPAIRAALKEIAADEGRHAAHGWDVVAWRLAEGGAPVARALLGALRGLPPTMRSPLPAEAGDGAWERWGIHGHALEAEEYGRALADLDARVRRAVAMPPPRDPLTV